MFLYTSPRSRTRCGCCRPLHPALVHDAEQQPVQSYLPSLHHGNRHQQHSGRVPGRHGFHTQRQYQGCVHFVASACWWRPALYRTRWTPAVCWTVVTSSLLDSGHRRGEETCHWSTRFGAYLFIFEIICRTAQSEFYRTH